MAKRLFLIIALMAAAAGLEGQPRPAFDDDFLDQALRFELYFVGDARDEFITIDQVSVEGSWPESTDMLVEPFASGRYTVKLVDIATNRLIYSRGFDTMFGEYRTTTPAREGVQRVSPRSVRVPRPKRPALLVIESRDKRNLSHPMFTRAVDPDDDHLIRENEAAGDEVYEARLSGAPQDKVDLLFIAEGYTAEDRAKFKADVDRFSGYLFKTEPYQGLPDRFNIRGLFRPSAERGMDEPRQKVFKKTELGASFNAFDLDRYMLIEDGHRLRELAARTPYDTIVVLVNSTRYGGGGIYNDYCVTTVDNEASRAVFLHEFGHSFAGLADEYYAADVAYSDFYPKGVEPLEPNITALLDPARVKWRDLLAPGLSIPTDWGQDKIDAFQEERTKNRRAMDRAADEARRKGLGADRVAKVEKTFKDRDQALAKKIDEVRRAYAHLNDKVGVFEGAGYAAKGLYRPMVYCMMITSPTGEFCRVCQGGIRRMIEFFSNE